MTLLSFVQIFVGNFFAVEFLCVCCKLCPLLLFYLSYFVFGFGEVMLCTSCAQRTAIELTASRILAKQQCCRFDRSLEARYVLGSTCMCACVLASVLVQFKKSFL